MFVGPSAAAINLNVDGSAAVVTSGVEIGSGAMVQAAPQIVAAELGLRPDDVIVRQADTDAAGYDVGVGGGRATVSLGAASRAAAIEVRGKLLRDVQSLPVRSASPAGRSTRPGFQRLAHPAENGGWRNGREVIQDGCGGVDSAESPGVKGGGLSGAGTDFGPPNNGFIGYRPVIARVLAELPRGDIHPTFVFHDDARGFLNASWRRPMAALSAPPSRANQARLRPNLGDLINAASLYREPRSGAPTRRNRGSVAGAKHCDSQVKALIT